MHQIPERRLLGALMHRKRLLKRYLQRLSIESKITNIDTIQTRHLVDKWQIFPSSTLRNENALALPAHLSKEYRKKTALLLKNVSVWPENSVALGCNSKLIDATAFTLPRLRQSIQKGDFVTKRRLRERKLSICIECGRWKNYYHTLIDVLPRIYCLYDRHISDLGGVTCYLTRLEDDKYGELLHALMPSWVEIKKVGTETLIHFDQYLHLPYLSECTCGWLPPEYVKFFRESTAGVRRSKSELANKKILISRSLALVRRIRNQDRLSGMLRELGFNAHCLENYSLREQASLFENAKSVIGPHGAGLTNLLFSKAGTKVVEIFPDQGVWPHYRWLCEALSHEYSDIHFQESHKNSDFDVDIERVLATI